MMCRDLQEYLALYADGSLEGEEALQVDKHLAACPRCREELLALQEMLGLIKTVPEPPAPPGLHRHIMAGIKGEKEKHKKRGREYWFGIPRTVAAAAAVFILFFAGGNYYLGASLLDRSPRADYGVMEELGADSAQLAEAPEEMETDERGATEATEATEETLTREEEPLAAPVSRYDNPLRNLTLFNAGLFALGGGFWYYYRRKTTPTEETGD